MRGIYILVGAGLFAACSSEFANVGDAADAGGSDGAPDGTLGPGPGSTDSGATDSGSDGGSDAGGDADAAGVDAGTPIKSYTVLGEISYAFAKPYSLAIDSTDHVYVSEAIDDADTHTLYLNARSYYTNTSPGHARILKFDSAGTYLGWIGAGDDATYGFHDTNSTAKAVYGDLPGQFMGIRGMTFDANDHLFVLDGRRVQELDATYAFIHWAGFLWPSSYGWQTTSFPDPYNGPNIGGFSWASTVRLHGGKMWIGNWYWNYPGFVPNGDWNCISVLDLSTGLGVGWLGGAKNTSTNALSAGYFNVGAPLQPRSEVAHMAENGVFTSPRQFVWHNDLIYVVDNTSDPVLSVFDANGVMQPGKLAHLSGAGEKPFAIAVDKYGNVIVSDMYTGSVRFFSTKLDVNGEFTQVAEWQVDTPSTENVFYPRISDFAWDSQDNLYVAATTKDKVYKIKLSY